MAPVLAAVVVLTGACASRRPTELPGFVRSPHFDEQVKSYAFEPNVTVHVNAPAAAAFDARKPICVAIFALPNGNTIPQTIGCAQRPELDWHFFIQHIGAQVRVLRATLNQTNLVIAYIEAGGRSWPAWRKQYADSGPRLVALVDSIRGHFPAETTTVALTAHSGGGSMLLGYIEQVEQIPDYIERIVFLDANYGYSAASGHAEKLRAWLKRSREHYLGVVAYDDREIELNGKKIIGPTGGTWRRTREMAADFERMMPLAATPSGDRETWRALDGRVDFELLANPENKILHTVLVERNGFIHALTFGTPAASESPGLFDPPAYEPWVQSEPAAL